jgi:hypothetical protein
VTRFLLPVLAFLVGYLVASRRQPTAGTAWTWDWREFEAVDSV